MKIKWQVLMAILIIFIGVGGLLAYQLYAIPYVFAKSVVKLKTAEYLPKNHVLSKEDLVLSNVPTEHIPAQAITDLSNALGKKINTDLTNGTILTKNLVDVDDLAPGQGEGIYPIPKEKIFAVNGTLRAGDKVKVYAIDAKDNTNVRINGQISSTTVTDPATKVQSQIDLTAQLDTLQLTDKPLITSARVSFVRSDDNNDVQDKDGGNVNKRLTSTGRVASPELKLTDQQGEDLKKAFMAGYKVWIVRVE